MIRDINVTPFFLLLFTMCCSLRDLWTGRIPNSYILCGLSAGSARLAVRLLCADTSGPALSDCLLGFCLPYLLLGVLAALRMLGAGDVKLFSVIGLVTGAVSCARVILYSLLIGGVFSFIILIRRGNAFSRFHYLAQYLRYSAESVRKANILSIPAYREKGNPSACEDGEFCFSAPIFLALALLMIRQLHP